MSTLRLLFRSRKFVVALGSLVLAVLSRVTGLDPETVNTMTILIMTVASAYIVGTAAEDVAHNVYNGRMGEPRNGETK